MPVAYCPTTELAQDISYLTYDMSRREVWRLDQTGHLVSAGSYMSEDESVGTPNVLLSQELSLFPAAVLSEALAFAKTYQAILMMSQSPVEVESAITDDGEVDSESLQEPEVTFRPWR